MKTSHYIAALVSTTVAATYGATLTGLTPASGSPATTNTPITFDTGGYALPITNRSSSSGGIQESKWFTDKLTFTQGMSSTAMSGTTLGAGAGSNAAGFAQALTMFSSTPSSYPGAVTSTTTALFGTAEASLSTIVGSYPTSPVAPTKWKVSGSTETLERRGGVSSASTSSNLIRLETDVLPATGTSPAIIEFNGQAGTSNGTTQTLNTSPTFLWSGSYSSGSTIADFPLMKVGGTTHKLELYNRPANFGSIPAIPTPAISLNPADSSVTAGNIVVNGSAGTINIGGVNILATAATPASLNATTLITSPQIRAGLLPATAPSEAFFVGGNAKIDGNLVSGSLTSTTGMLQLGDASITADGGWIEIPSSNISTLNVGTLPTSAPGVALHVGGDTKVAGNAEVAGALTIWTLQGGYAAINDISVHTITAGSGAPAPAGEALYVDGNSRFDGSLTTTLITSPQIIAGVGPSTTGAALHVGGNAKVDGPLAVGQNNASTSNNPAPGNEVLFSVGNGNSAMELGNALTVLKDGTVNVSGALNLGGQPVLTQANASQFVSRDVVGNSHIPGTLIAEQISASQVLSGGQPVLTQANASQFVGCDRQIMFDL
jgi:hypothetical protein